METIKNIFTLIEKKRAKIVFFIIFSSILLAFLELIGIAAIPIYLSFLLNPEIFMEKFTLVNLAFLKKIDKDNLLIFGSISIFIFFLTKKPLFKLKYLFNRKDVYEC